MPRATRSSTKQLSRAAELVAAAVSLQCRHQTEARSLGAPDPMPTSWRLSDHDSRGTTQAILLDELRTLRPCRLVITGPPGSGKTALAAQLVLHLLDDARDGEPVPVLLSLASWDPQKCPRLQDWLPTQLARTYPDLRELGRGAARGLADAGRLFPVLDGLDGLPADRRGLVIDHLNAALPPDAGLILISRTAEYHEGGQILTGAVVVEAEPFSADAAAAYLETLLPRHPDASWQAVLAALRGGTAGALAEVVAAPPGLWLVHAVYIEDRRDPRDLLDPAAYPDPAAIQNHLLDEVLPAALRTRPPVPAGANPLRPTRHHTPDQVRRWLTSLAVELRDARTRNWEWWRLTSHTFTRPQAAIWFAVLVGLSGMVGGFAGALLLDVAEGMLDESGALAYSLQAGLGYEGGRLGLTSGLAGGLTLAVLGGRRGAPVQGDPRWRDRTRTFAGHVKRGWLRGTVAGAFLGVVLGLATVVTQGQILSPAIVPVAGIVFGLVVGLPTGVASFVASRGVARPATSPRESLRRARRLMTSTIGILTVIIGLLIGLFTLGAAGRPTDPTQLAFGFVGVLIFSGTFAAVLVPALTAACPPAFAMTSLWLWLRGRRPLRMMGFLDDAYRLGLLRIVGPAYQFRYTALHDHLAPQATSPSTLDKITGSG